MHFDGLAGAMESVGRLGEDDWIGRYFDLVGRQVAIQTYLSYQMGPVTYTCFLRMLAVVYPNAYDNWCFGDGAEQLLETPNVSRGRHMAR